MTDDGNGDSMEEQKENSWQINIVADSFVPCSLSTAVSVKEMADAVCSFGRVQIEIK